MGCDEVSKKVLIAFIYLDMLEFIMSNCSHRNYKQLRYNSLTAPAGSPGFICTDMLVFATEKKQQQSASGCHTPAFCPLLF